MSNRRAVLIAAAIVPALAAALLVQACSARPGVLGHPPGPAAHRRPAPTLYIYATGVGPNNAKVVTPVNTATDTPGKPIHVGLPGTWAGGMIVITPDGKTAYVTTAPGPITPINMATGTPGKRIRIRNTTNAPDFIAMAPDGKTVYVTQVGSPTNVTPVSTATNTPGTPIKIRSGFPPNGGQIVFTPDGKTAYVTTWFFNTIIPINTATNTPGTPIRVRKGGRVSWIAITPDGKTLYVLTVGGPANTFLVTPISTVTGTPGKPIPIGAASAPSIDAIGVDQIVITPDGKTAYVTTVSGVTPINTATNTPGKPIHVGFNPMHGGEIAITPDGKTAYVTSQNRCQVKGRRCTYTVTPINTATDTPGTPIPVGSGPTWFTPEIVITPDGKTVYAANNSGTITPINTATCKPGKPIHVVGSTVNHAIAIAP